MSHPIVRLLTLGWFLAVAIARGETAPGSTIGVGPKAVDNDVSRGFAVAGRHLYEFSFQGDESGVAIDRPVSPVELLSAFLGKHDVSDSGGTIPTGSLDLADSSDCFDWRPGNGIAGVNGTINTMIVWDDGTGPALYVGGAFSVAGDVLAANVAKWDGTQWSAVGSGTLGGVNALSVYNGELIAGGFFTSVGGITANHIARWDGSEWAPLGSGTDDVVRSLTEFNGELIAGGDFLSAGGISANRIARWDGAGWSPLGAGPFSGSVGSVVALQAYGGELIAAAGFSIARWDGSGWQSLATGLNMAVSALITFDGDLIAGGNYSTSNVKRWNGVGWEPLGAGPQDGVRALITWNNELIVAGNFGYALGYSRVARWDGANWVFITIGSGPSSSGNYYSALEAYNGQLIVGRSYSYGDYSLLTSWNGETWSSAGNWAGLNNAVEAFALFDGRLVAAGSFSMAGGLLASHLATWDGTAWAPLRGVFGYTPWALTVFDGELIAAGPGGYVQHWNGTAWQRLGTGTNGLYSARALLVYDGALIAGGTFSQSGGVPVNYIARWDGTQLLEIGGGMNNAVYALGEYNGDLIAGGVFSVAGGVAASKIARWDGDHWNPLGAGLGTGFAGSEINALAVYDGKLIAGGLFTVAQGAPADYIAQWDGVEWSPLGSEFVTWYVDTLAVYDGELVAGGGFSQHVARWDGIGWRPMANGIHGDSVNALHVYNGELFVGGYFFSAGDQASAFFARWGPTFSDLDGDHQLGLGDLLPIGSCLQGPGAQFELGCDCADADTDGDVDLGDFAYFQMRFDQSP